MAKKSDISASAISRDLRYTDEEIETMKLIIGDHSHRAKHPDFPKLVYKADGHKVVANAEEMEAAFEDGYTKQPEVK